MTETKQHSILYFETTDVEEEEGEAEEERKMANNRIPRGTTYALSNFEDVRLNEPNSSSY